MGCFPHVGARHEELHRAGAVAQGGEGQLSLTAQQENASRDPHGVARLCAGSDAVPPLVELLGGVRPVEPDGVGVGARGAQGIELLQATLALASGRVRHWLRSKMMRRPCNVNHGS